MFILWVTDICIGLLIKSVMYERQCIGILAVQSYCKKLYVLLLSLFVITRHLTSQLVQWCPPQRLGLHSNLKNSLTQFAHSSINY